MLSGEECTAKLNVFSFSLILFEIVVSFPVLGRTGASEELEKLLINGCERVEIPGFVPSFISMLVESGLSTNSSKIPSFNNVSEALNKNYFSIADGVDSNEVSAFVSLVESSEM
jgi:hypothetical protein